MLLPILRWSLISFKGSPWESSFRADFPNGWELLTNVEGLAQRGDLYTLRYVAEKHPERITDPSRQCGIISAAIQSNHMDIVEFLAEEMSYNISMTCDFSFTLLDVALYFYDQDETIPMYLSKRGARSSQDIMKQNDIDGTIRMDERCALVKEALSTRNSDVLYFLVDQMEYDVNMCCFPWHTLLDAALRVFDEEDEIIEVLLEYGAMSYDDQIQYILEPY